MAIFNYFTQKNNNSLKPMTGLSSLQSLKQSHLSIPQSKQTQALPSSMGKLSSMSNTSNNTGNSTGASVASADVTQLFMQLMSNLVNNIEKGDVSASSNETTDQSSNEKPLLKQSNDTPTNVEAKGEPNPDSIPNNTAVEVKTPQAPVIDNPVTPIVTKDNTPEETVPEAEIVVDTDTVVNDEAPLDVVANPPTTPSDFDSESTPDNIVVDNQVTAKAPIPIEAPADAPVITQDNASEVAQGKPSNQSNDVVANTVTTEPPKDNKPNPAGHVPTTKGIADTDAKPLSPADVTAPNQSGKEVEGKPVSPINPVDAGMPSVGQNNVRPGENDKVVQVQWVYGANSPKGASNWIVHYQTGQSVAENDPNAIMGSWQNYNMAVLDRVPVSNGPNERNMIEVEVNNLNHPELDEYQLVMLPDGTQLKPDEEGRYFVPADTKKICAFRIWGETELVRAATHQSLSARVLTQTLDDDNNVIHETRGPKAECAANTPLTVDLDNDGIETLSSSNGVMFDFMGNAMQTGWVGSDDGLLVHDINKDGQINSSAELFGDSTQMAGGMLARDGFEALAQFDENKDGVINESDEIYDELKIWQDSNGDGSVQDGELKTVADWNIASLDLNAKHTTIEQQDNTIGLMSHVTTTDGTQLDFADVWFGAKINSDAEGETE